MTYLELCQATLEASDTGNEVALTSLTDVDQYQRGVTRKVAEAWHFIQTIHESWGWRQREFVAQLRPGVMAYKWFELFDGDENRSIPTAVGFRDWLAQEPGDPAGAEWYISSPDNDYASVTSITPIAFETMRQRRFVLTTPAKPTTFTVTPSVELVFHANPDAAHRIHGMHVTGVQSLTSANDVPVLPDEEYHNIIKWRAVMMIHGSDEAGDSYAFAQAQYKEMLQTLEKKYLPSISIGGPLA